MTAKKRRLKASDIDKLENTSMASALIGADIQHNDGTCAYMSCGAVSGIANTCSDLGVCCTGCTYCSGCTACSACTACAYRTDTAC